METTQLMKIESAPAQVSVNFEELKKQLSEHVAQYDVVVTADGVKDAKELATQLNKEKGELNRIRKEKIDEVSAPIKAFDDQMKELIGLYEEGRQKILEQVKKFEDETREQVRDLLADRRREMWQELGVDEEFRRAEYDDLIKLTAITGKGNLAAAAKRDIDARCQADRSLQDRTSTRLLELENRSYKAGLKAPLTRDHVEPFLFDDEERYEAEIERILTAEVARQDRIESEARQKMQREEERRQAEEAERAAREEAQQAEAVEKSGTGAPKEASAPEPATDGKVAWSVTCTFRVECSPKVTKAQIEQQLQKVLAEAGITTLQSVNAVSQYEEAA